jgi:hypothetical protein
MKDKVAALDPDSLNWPTLPKKLQRVTGRHDGDDYYERPASQDKPTLLLWDPRGPAPPMDDEGYEYGSQGIDDYGDTGECYCTGCGIFAGFSLL